LLHIFITLRIWIIDISWTARNTEPRNHGHSTEQNQRNVDIAVLSTESFVDMVT